MSAFKEQLDKDLDDVFFSEFEEFWEECKFGNNTENIRIRCVVDNDELIRRAVKKVYNTTDLKTHTIKKLIMCKANEYETKIGHISTVGERVLFNDEWYTVNDSDVQMGLLILELNKLDT